MLRDMARTKRPASLDPDVRLLAALADPTRLAIVRQLAAEADVCACDFTSCCAIARDLVPGGLIPLGALAAPRPTPTTASTDA